MQTIKSTREQDRFFEVTWLENGHAHGSRFRRLELDTLLRNLRARKAKGAKIETLRLDEQEILL